MKRHAPRRKHVRISLVLYSYCYHVLIQIMSSPTEGHQSAGAAGGGNVIRQPLRDRSNDKGLRPQLILRKDGSFVFSTSNSRMHSNVKSHRSASTTGGRKITKSHRPLQDQTNNIGLITQTGKNESSVTSKRSSQKDTLKPKALVMGPSNEATCSKKKTCTYFTCLVFTLLSHADSNVLSH
jgi:hypothetical protein